MRLRAAVLQARARIVSPSLLVTRPHRKCCRLDPLAARRVHVELCVATQPGTAGYAERTGVSHDLTRMPAAHNLPDRGAN